MRAQSASSSPARSWPWLTWASGIKRRPCAGLSAAFRSEPPESHTCTPKDRGGSHYTATRASRTCFAACDSPPEKRDRPLLRSRNGVCPYLSVGRRFAAAAEGIGELAEVGLGRLEVDGAVVLRPVVGLVRGAEEEVPHRQEGGEVLVDAFLVGGVVPVVVLGRGDQPAQVREAPAQVGVDEDRVEGNEHEVAVQRRRGEAQDEYRQEREGARHEHIDDVHARAGEPVHLAA